MNTANDKALTLSVAATPNTGIVANSNVKLTVKLSSAPQDAYSYKVTLTVNGEEKSVVLDQSNATAGADIWVNNVTSDVNVTAAQVEVASPLMAIENVEWTTGSVTITFTCNVGESTVASGITAGTIASSATINADQTVVSGKTVTLYFNGNLAANDTIKVAKAVAEDGVSGNKITSTQSGKKITLTNSAFDASNDLSDYT